MTTARTGAPRTGLDALRQRALRLGAGTAALALGFGVLPALSTIDTAHAAVVTPGDLVINEIYGGGGNKGAAYQNDFVELKNTTDADIDLTGWSLQYASKTGAFNNTMTLSGTVPAGKTFLIMLAPGNGKGEKLPAADLEGDINASGNGGVFALSDAEGKLACTGVSCADNPAVIDLVGWGDAKTFSGTAPAPKTNNSTSVSRIASSGENSTDFAAGAPTPTPSGATEQPPGNDGGDDEAEPPSHGTVMPIAEIQGTGEASPYDGKTVTTEGVVTAVYAEGGLNGYVVQTGGTGGLLDFSSHRASAAIFVYSPDTMKDVKIGDSVTVTGTVSEYYGSTQISVKTGGMTPAEAPFEAPKPVQLESFPSKEEERESMEHMLYQPGADDFTVTDVYQTSKYGEITLAMGIEPLRQAGDVMAPGEEATAYYQEQQAKKVLLDDARTTNFAKNPSAPMSWLTTQEPVRVGASVNFTQPVIVSYSFEQWRLNPTAPWTSHDTDGVDFENTRQDAPAKVGGDLQIATFNVLNYFTTLGEDTPGCQPYTNMDGEGTNVRGGCLPRGAWNKASFERQQSKIVDAISGTGAEVVGLMEIENSARLGEEADEATASLVKALNAKDGEGTWAFIPTGEAYKKQGLDGGGDAITSAIIYKPAAVRPEGETQILAGHEAFDNAREPIAHVFVPVRKGKDGKTVEGEPFLFTVNHFKSKGSKDAEDANLTPDPVQGNARTSRMQQAEALHAWATERAEALKVKAVLHGGDFNAYTKEDPLQYFYDQGFVNAVAEHEEGAWSYSFGGMVGSLDHVLANEAAAARITGATDWSINGPESVMTQYSRYRNNEVNLYEEGVFGSSDHNPLIVGLDAGFPKDEKPEEPGKPGDPGDDEKPGKPGEPGDDDKPGTPGGNAGDGKGSGAGDLARTGAPGLLIGGVAASLLAAGAVLMGRRRS